MMELGLVAAGFSGFAIAFFVVWRQRNRAAAARHQLLSMIDALPALVSYVDAEQRYQFVNRAYEDWFGHPRSSVLGRPLADVLGPAAYARVGPYVNRVLHGESLRFRAELPYATGGTRVVEIYYVPDRHTDRRTRGYWALVLDVTDEARAAERTRNTEAAAVARFRTMADHAPVFIWMSSADKARTWFNRPWLEFTGRSLEEELGNGWTARIHGEDLSRCLEIYTRSFDARQPFTIEYRLRRHDGEYRWVLDTGVPLHDEQGDFTGYIGSCIDINERRRVEQEHTRLLVDAEAANRLKDEFLATLSHELRTPLNTVLGWTHLLRDSAKTEKEMKHALDVIERNVRIQSKLVEDVLDVSRIVSGKLRLELQTVDIANIVQAAVNVLQPSADAKGVSLSVDVRHGHGFVAGDPSRLQQAIWNVVANGVKFTRRGGSVDVQARRRHGHVEIRVSDSGIGIEPEFLPHVFERFRQEDGGYAREHAGLGLGLAIVKHLVELHGGTVAIHSAGKNQGTTATLQFPLLAVHPVEHAGATGPIQHPMVVGVRVLAVDDDPDALTLIVKILENGGAIVTGVESTAEALTALETQSFDVLLSDLAMPGEDGCDLLRKVRLKPAELGGNIPAAALTAYARSEDRTRVLLAGFDLHIAKPIDPAELLAVVQTLAAKRALDSTELPRAE